MYRASYQPLRVRGGASAADRNNRVTVYYNSTTRTANSDGQRPESETEYCKRSASIIPKSAAERLIARQLKDDVTHVVRMRYDNQTKSITSAYWFDDRDGTRYNIVAGPFDVDGRKKEIMFDVVERR